MTVGWKHGKATLTLLITRTFLSKIKNNTKETLLEV